MSTAYITLITDDAIIDAGWDTYLIDATNNNVELTLTDVISDGIWFRISRIDNSNNTVTIIPDGTSQINFTTSLSLDPHENVSLCQHDTNWYTIGGKWS